MILRYAQGFNQQNSVADFPYEPTLDEPVGFDMDTAASGLSSAVGGGKCRVSFAYLTKEEAQILLPYLGINSRTPARACTLFIEDLFGIPLFYNGYVNLIMPRGGQAWWVDLALEFSALERI